jgi:plastocyanin
VTTSARGYRWFLGSLSLVALVVATSGAARTDASARPTRHTIEIRAMEFHPAVLEVAKGDTVVWINRDIVPHTATAAAVAPPAWDTGTLTAGQSGRYVPGHSGEALYTCTLHPTMRGKLIIR